MLGNCLDTPGKKLRLFVGNAFAFFVGIESVQQTFPFRTLPYPAFAYHSNWLLSVLAKMAYDQTKYISWARHKTWPSCSQESSSNFRCNVRKCSHSVLVMFAYFNVNICTLTWLLDSQTVRQFALSLFLSLSAISCCLFRCLQMQICLACKSIWTQHKCHFLHRSAALLYIIWLCVHTRTHTHICLSKKIAWCFVREPTRNLSSWLHS